MQIVNNAPYYNMSHHAPAHQQSSNGSRHPPVAESAIITVEFIAFTAEELARMVTQGHLPPTVHGADVYMQNANNQSQRVSKTYFKFKFNSYNSHQCIFLSFSKY